MTWLNIASYHLAQSESHQRVRIETQRQNQLTNRRRLSGEYLAGLLVPLSSEVGHFQGNQPSLNRRPHVRQLSELCSEPDHMPNYRYRS